MAASEPTGPRRGQRAILLDPLLEDASPSEPRFMRAASSAAAKLSVATSSVNLFTRPVVASDAETLRRGRAKTWIFVGLFGIASITILAFYVANPTVVTGTLRTPSLDDYLAYEQYTPTCPCSGATVAGDAAQFHLADAVNMSYNLCGPVVELGLVCGAFNMRERPQYNCTQTLEGAALWHGVLESVTYTCATWQGAISTQMANALGTNLGPILLTPESLNRTIMASALSSMQLAISFVAINTSPMDVAVRAYAATTLDISTGSLSQSPPSCSCRAEFMNDLLQQVNSPCSFRAVFDVRETPLADTWWTCNHALNFQQFPLSLLLRNETYAALSLPPPYDMYMNFLGASNITENTTADDFLFAAEFALFPPTIDDDPDASQLQPGLVTLDFPAYFAKCAPAMCTYSYRGRPSFLAALTTALGVISGLQTVLTLLVDRGYDAAFKRPPASDNAVSADATSDTTPEHSQQGVALSSVAAAGTAQPMAVVAPGAQRPQ